MFSENISSQSVFFVFLLYSPISVFTTDGVYIYFEPPLFCVSPKIRTEIRAQQVKRRSF